LLSDPGVGRDGMTFREEEIAGVAVSDIADITAFAEMGDV
jgi:hypothetical protein